MRLKNYSQKIAAPAWDPPTGYALPAVSGGRHSGRLLLRPVAGFYSAVDTLRTFTDLIDREAAEFRAFVTALPRLDHVGRGAGRGA